jgi:hypothetical protein
MRSIIAACLCIIGVAGALPALSHHSTANFDQTKKVTITGKVTFFRFTNPHSHIDIEVPVEGGAPRTYKIFTVATTVMSRSGWTREDVKVGDQVTATGNPDRTDPTFMHLTQIVFANGKTWNWDLIP